jgi:hypothetical protein
MSKQLGSVMAPKWHIPLRHPRAGMKVPRAGDLSSPLSDDSFSSIFGRTEPRCNGSGRKRAIFASREYLYCTFALSTIYILKIL